MPAPLSVIIPTLNAAAALPETAEALLPGATEGLIRDLVITDGGSSDETWQVAKALGAVWIEGPPGRGGQIARGVDASSAPWLLILHADTHLSDGWTFAVREHMRRHPEGAGYFRLIFRADGMAPRFVAAGANLRSRILQLPYGDQGLLISRALLAEVGGIPEIPLMEDVALADKLKGRLHLLDAEARTAADRYRRDGWLRRAAENLGTLIRYRFGAKPEELLQRYGK